MDILYDKESGVFHLRNRRMSYILALVAGKYLTHAYWGPRLSAFTPDYAARYGTAADDAFTLHELSLEALPQEMPTYGYGDARDPALHVRHADGSHTVELTYQSHEIIDGKPALDGLPAAYGDAGACRTLLLHMLDAPSGLRVTLSYTVFSAIDAIARSAKIVNGGTNDISLERVMSASVDFDTSDFSLLTLSGAWARERDIDLRPLVPGEQSVGAIRGASSHQSSPFLALLEPDATETHGRVYAMALVYSGNFYAGVRVGQLGMARAQIGIHPFEFSWLLAPGDMFQTPEALLVYSGEGLTGMSHAYHALCRRHIVRGKYAGQIRPMLINNWEATYFNFDEPKLLDLAQLAKDVGIEMFVLDDGWFGHRDKDNSSLGDWVEDRRKLPDGIEGLSRKIHGMGLRFGLWFEPEMISPDSDLYRAHPDWCLHVPGRERLEVRQQLVLDMTREEVRRHIIDAVSDVLRRGEIDYVKWDMNRNFQSCGSAALPSARQTELSHRYMLGLYSVLETITQRFPDVLFESCAGGGGRFDLGMMHYMPQAWCSDNTDAIARCRIQVGTSLVFPPDTMGAHVSAVPNHQTHRTTPLWTRANVATSGTFGYEMDLTVLPEAELREMAAVNDYVKQVRHTLLYGQFYRLRTLYDGAETAWMSVADDRREAIVTWVGTLRETNHKATTLRLRGLDETLRYRIAQTGEVIGGDVLTHRGLLIPPWAGDFASLSFHLIAQ